MNAVACRWEYLLPEVFGWRCCEECGKTEYGTRTEKARCFVQDAKGNRNVCGMNSADKGTEAAGVVTRSIPAVGNAVGVVGTAYMRRKYCLVGRKSDR